MRVVTFEGVVVNGQIRLSEPIALPDNARVYVLVPNLTDPVPLRIMSPKLANPQDAARFEKIVVEEPPNAHL